MHQYRQVLVRIRHGDSDRELARCRYMGRRKLAALRELAEQRGWLKPDAPLPDDAEIAAALGSPRKATSTVSGLEVHRALIASWLEQNVPVRISANVTADFGNVTDSAGLGVAQCRL
ncbi:hypothetical protein [Burkholderia vietnamiensis]